MLSQYEEAIRCPRCEQPGKLANTTRPRGVGIGRGTKVETYECVNERCENGPCEHPILGMQEGERWAVQINADGSIPPKNIRSQQPKNYDFMANTTEGQRQRARDMAAWTYEQSVRGGEER